MLFMARGFTIKTPQYYTRAGVAVVLVVIGFVLIALLVFHDQLLGNDQELGHLEMLGILFGSFLIVVGSLLYISIKFPDTRMMKVFKQAVKEEIRKRAAEEQQWRSYQVKQARANRMRRKQVQVKASVSAKKKEKKAKSKRSGAGAGATATQIQTQSQLQAQTATMIPADNLTIVNCSKCGRSLKVSSPERPVTIKCPYCEAIGVIKD
jgi:hypothetical protein